jgi:chromosome partitioning protein
VPEDQIERTIYDAMIEESDGRVAKIGEIIWQIASDFDLAPSNMKLAAFEQVFSGRAGREDRLLQALEPARNTHQWVILDCPPSVGLLTFNALRACDQVIVPVETGFFSLHGLTKMMETLEMLKERCSKDILIRVLPTLYDTRTKLAREVLSELRAKFRDYLMESTINFNTKLKEAASFGQPITEYDPGSRGYKDFVNLARELMGHRPTEVEATPTETLSRPAELVQRARQLAQLASFQFGSRNNAPVAPVTQSPAQEPELVGASGPSVELRIAPTEVAEGNEEDYQGLQRTHAGASVALEEIPMTANTPAKTTAQKIDEFYGVKQIGREIVFAAHFAHARQVMIAGDFNNWTPTATPMIPVKPGVWRTRLKMSAGRYRYRLVVDNKWITDPNNQYVEVNQFGELNNVVDVD